MPVAASVAVALASICLQLQPVHAQGKRLAREQAPGTWHVAPPPQVTRAPAATPPGGAASGDDDKDGKDSKKAKRKGPKGRGGGGARVVGGEAHAVLSHILDGAESSTRNAWVFDGSGILYTVASELGEKAAAVAATTAAAVGQASEAAAGGQGSDVAEGQEGGAAAGGGGGGDGGFLVQLPDGTSELAAGAYRVSHIQYCGPMDTAVDGALALSSEQLQVAYWQQWLRADV